MARLFALQREGSAERTNGRPEEVAPRETAAHLTNGDSPNRQSPVLLSREPQVSPKPLCVGEYHASDELHAASFTLVLWGLGFYQDKEKV